MDWLINAVSISPFEEAAREWTFRWNRSRVDYSSMSEENIAILKPTTYSLASRRLTISGKIWLGDCKHVYLNLVEESEVEGDAWIDKSWKIYLKPLDFTPLLLIWFQLPWNLHGSRKYKAYGSMVGAEDFLRPPSNLVYTCTWMQLLWLTQLIGEIFLAIEPGLMRTSKTDLEGGGRTYSTTSMLPYVIRCFAVTWTYNWRW